MRPNFKEIDIEKVVAPQGDHKPVEGKEWLTAELIPVKPVYTAADLEGMEHLDYVAGLPPFLRGPYSAMYPMRPLDHPPVRRILDCRRVQRLLPP